MATTFEELIGETGGFGLFQILVVAMLLHNKIQVSWSMLHMTYGGVIPDYYCISSPEDSTPSDDTLNVCDVNVTVWSDDGYAIVGQQQVPCSSYNFKPTYHTVISEFNLVCDEKWVKATVTSIQMAGVLVGSFIVGQMADVLGRKKVTYAVLLEHALFNLMAAFSINWQMFAACRFFIGIGTGAALVLVTPYPMEFVQQKWRPMIGILPVWSFGVCLFALAAWILNDWKWLHVTNAVLCIPGLLTYFYVPESMRWLATQGRVDEAVVVMEKVAKTNKKKMPDNTRQIFQDIAQTEKKDKEAGKKYSYLDLVRSLDMAKLTAIGCYIWFCLSLIYYGISFAVSSLAGNIFLNIFLLSILDFPVTFLAIYLVNRIGRKIVCISAFLLCLIFSGACLGVQLLVPEEDQGLSITILSILAKVSVLTAWVVHSVWMIESYPTVIRNLGFGVVNTASRFGGIAAPFLINFDSMIVESYIIICCLLVLCLLGVAFTRETKGVDLSDSLSAQKTPASVEANGNIESKTGESPVATINTRF